MSTFVLHPPPQLAGRVQVVSFFITARLAAQDTREAFTTVLLQQLADLSGQALPPVLGEDVREAVLLDLLAQAAEAARAGGGRLVLVVDGLDEDRGVTLGPHAHSIAALLPADPPAGMRVIVAGRPNPPIPDDVPDHHPLRDPGIIRLLSDSPHARDLQRLGQSELRRLLDGTSTERDLLGLLTAARGGLSGRDLEELTTTPVWQIEQILHTVAGRTFTRRGSHWTPDTGPEVYLLGHEELHNTAVGYLGGQRLAGYRERLHAWADTYRQRGWPTGTPEYLLSGYTRMLATLGDLPHLTALACDSARHDRMLDLTGGDAAALAEIRTTLDLICKQDIPNLTDALHLAYHRDQLADRNTNIPTDLPAVWVALGHHTRAQALAQSITDPYRQTEALTEVARALGQAGHHDQAAALAGAAEQTARTITDPYRQAQALTAVAQALAQAGDARSASRVAVTACAVGQWTSVVEVVLQLDASAADLLRDLFSERVP
jgi:hypothetical protein